MRKRWVWWRIPRPDRPPQLLGNVIVEHPSDVRWHTPAETTRILSQMSPANRAKVNAATKSGSLAVGAVYKRTRTDASGKKVQRAEVRFDGVAGCLRTPAGGSSRQVILVVKGEEVHSRLLSSREAARLMGLPDSYILPRNYNEAYHCAGDGVAVPVVRHIAQSILEPILETRAILQAAE